MRQTERGDRLFGIHQVIDAIVDLCAGTAEIDRFGAVGREKQLQFSHGDVAALQSGVVARLERDL